MATHSQHEWDWIGIDEMGREWGYCRLCRQYRVNGGKPRRDCPVTLHNDA